MNENHILFIPALALSGELYAAQRAGLEGQYTTTIGDHTRDSSLTAMAQRILNDAPERFTLVGLSMGGYAAFEIMRQAPERVSRLVLMDTNPQEDSPDKHENRLRQIAVAEGGKYESLLEPMYLGLVAAKRHNDAALKARVLAMMREAGAGVFVNQQRAILSRPDSAPLLPDIRVPVLVVVGEEDGLTTPAMAKCMADAIPGARFEVIAGAGHLSALESPEVVTG
ncbi:MAG: alpha/beta hydrolase, partial [Methylobacteriaceae bacterium]|nr:alpha/beta hydrolase [Methylobacteriaceae bacterium]